MVTAIGPRNRSRPAGEELLAALDPGERELLRALLEKVLAAHPAQPA
ncbi:hypothetical protein [Actinoplanes sp. RD1]|nr:hypothetical protein [Actinoplanes sp. RD1]